MKRKHFLIIITLYLLIIFSLTVFSGCSFMQKPKQDNLTEANWTLDINQKIEKSLADGIGIYSLKFKAFKAGGTDASGNYKSAAPALLTLKIKFWDSAVNSSGVIQSGALTDAQAMATSFKVTLNSVPTNSFVGVGTMKMRTSGNIGLKVSAIQGEKIEYDIPVTSNSVPVMYKINIKDSAVEVYFPGVGTFKGTVTKTPLGSGQ
jgi:hypothetical protein